MTSNSPASGERTRILIVPDGLFGPELGGSFLDREALLVRSAPDVTTALAVAGTWHPHLVVFRSEPRADAARLCTLKREPEPVPKLLMVTDSLESSANVDAAYDAHLISPLVPDELLAAIAELIDLRQRRSARAAIDVLVHTEGFVEGGANDATLSSALGLSEESMLLEASRHLGLRTRGQLQFFLPGSQERLTLEGAVRVAVDELRLIYVIDFIDLAPQHRALIRRYVDSQKEAA